ncbi:MAG: nucleotidyltransferase [Bacteroidota bacterium]|nr:nucleotidyltransferase [Bacteroidota bacterium]
MGNLFHPDFRYFIKVLQKHNVDYILVGGYAVILHGYERVTADMDIWVRCNEENYKKIQPSFQTFEMPVFDMTLANFLNSEKWDVFLFGRKPVVIDITTKVKGLAFNDAFQSAKLVDVDDIQVRLIQYDHLLVAKRQADRAKDINDLENL